MSNEGPDNVTISFAILQDFAKYKEVTERIPIDATRVDLKSRSISSIDLSPLASCKNLKELTLDGNYLDTIDLTPLATCTKLEVLGLDRNNLNTLDLSPLTTCTSLKSIAFEENQIETIDLSPLASCISLEAIDLSRNHIDTIDLTPLATCRNLGLLILNDNHIDTIDLTPLAFATSGIDVYLYDDYFDPTDSVHSWLKVTICETEVEYKRPMWTYPWSFLLKTAKEFGIDSRVQQDILLTMGLGHYGFIDYNFRNLLLSFPQDSHLETVREKIRERIMQEIVSTVDKKGATTGLKLDELQTEHGVFTVNSQQIIETRKMEMERVRVGVKGAEVDLRELYLTAYGYDILSTLGMRLTTNQEGLEQIRSTLSQLEFDLNTDETSISGVRMGEDLKQAIWWIVENRGKSWREIKD